MRAKQSQCVGLGFADLASRHVATDAECPMNCATRASVTSVASYIRAWLEVFTKMPIVVARLK
jgi:hypothetical protein